MSVLILQDGKLCCRHCHTRTILSDNLAWSLHKAPVIVVCSTIDNPACCQALLTIILWDCKYVKTSWHWTVFIEKCVDCFHWSVGLLILPVWEGLFYHKRKWHVCLWPGYFDSALLTELIWSVPDCGDEDYSYSGFIMLSDKFQHSGRLL